MCRYITYVGTPVHTSVVGHLRKKIFAQVGERKKYKCNIWLNIAIHMYYSTFSTTWYLHEKKSSPTTVFKSRKGYLFNPMKKNTVHPQQCSSLENGTFFTPMLAHFIASGHFFYFFSVVIRRTATNRKKYVKLKRGALPTKICQT